MCVCFAVASFLNFFSVLLVFLGGGGQNATTLKSEEKIEKEAKVDQNFFFKHRPPKKKTQQRRNMAHMIARINKIALAVALLIDLLLLPALLFVMFFAGQESQNTMLTFNTSSSSSANHQTSLSPMPEIPVADAKIILFAFCTLITSVRFVCLFSRDHKQGRMLGILNWMTFVMEAGLVELLHRAQVVPPLIAYGMLAASSITAMQLMLEGLLSSTTSPSEEMGNPHEMIQRTVAPISSGAESVDDSPMSSLIEETLRQEEVEEVEEEEEEVEEEEEEEGEKPLETVSVTNLSNVQVQVQGQTQGEGLTQRQLHQRRSRKV